MVTNILDLESMIRGYIIDTIKKYYPDIDTSSNSPFDDLFIKPVIQFSAPFIEALSRLELKSNLSNAEYLTEAELDEIGEGNYFTIRKKGYAATTVMTLTFANLNLEDPDFIIKIPTGTTFTTNSELEYQTQSTITLNAEDMQKNYNKAKFVYEIDIPVIAMEIGKKYNVSAGEIMFCKTFFSNSLVSSVNKVDVTDGKDQETNADYAARMREFYLSRQLGTSPGYKNFILEIFDEISDVYVAGYKDPYMERDVLNVVDEAGNVTPRHVGGMVDIYLKGCIYDENQMVVTLNNDVLLLDCDFGKLADTINPQNSIKIYNLTDSTKTVKLKEVRAVLDSEFFGENSGKTMVIIDNTNQDSYHDNVINQMKIIYSYIGSNGQIDDERYFDVGLTKTSLASPLVSVNSLIDVQGNSISGIDEKIIINKTGIEKTTNEECEIIIKNEKCNEYYNGMPIIVNYTSNKTLRRLRDTLNVENNRIITADVLGKEATPVPVNVRFKIRTEPIYKSTDRSIIETRIKASVISFFDNYKMGDTVEESDLVGWLYTDASVKDMIKYVALPFDVFYVPQNAADDIPTDGSQLSSDGVLSIKSIEYPILNVSKFEVSILKGGE